MNDQQTPKEFDHSMVEDGLSVSTYEWTGRLFKLLEKFLGVNLRLHYDDPELLEGDIFLFNHFARFETFIPQYLFYKEAGFFCRSIAASVFFIPEDPFSQYLMRVGAVPNNHPELLPMLAREILRGRKVIVFPEGGLVKDRRVWDEHSGYRVYSGHAEARRKHHRGPAVLGTAIELFRRSVREAVRQDDPERIEQWARAIDMEVDELVAAAARPTRIVPANITFYPIRVQDNLLRQGAEWVSRGLGRNLSEELLIEGNILLRDTDMDVRLGKVYHVGTEEKVWERWLSRHFSARTPSLDEVFRLGRGTRGDFWATRLLNFRYTSMIGRIRDQCMERMYAAVTVNLSQIASAVTLALVDDGVESIPMSDFRRLLYLAVKEVQRDAKVHLHPSLQNPQAYVGLLGGLAGDHCAGLDQFLRTTARMVLIDVREGELQLLPKLRSEHDFDEVRLENLVEVYANEVAPIEAVRHSIPAARKKAKELPADVELRLRFDDAVREFEWDKQEYSKPQHSAINELEPAVEPAAPFLLVPDAGDPARLGVIMVHGFLAAPAEMRSLAERAAKAGYCTWGVRLKGHGTSPWDLRDRQWEDWFNSLQRAYDAMRCRFQHIAVVGFSAGGSLALRFAAEQPPGLAGVSAICPALRFCDKNMRFVPIVHRANRVVRWLSSYEGVMPFQPQASIHPHINYHHMPVRGLYELGQLAQSMRSQLGEVRGPIQLLQSNRDPVVEPDGINEIKARLSQTEVEIEFGMIDSDSHGIVYEEVGDTHSRVLNFLAKLRVETPA